MVPFASYVSHDQGKPRLIFSGIKGPIASLRGWNQYNKQGIVTSP